MQALIEMDNNVPMLLLYYTYNNNFVQGFNIEQGKCLGSNEVYNHDA